MKYSVKVLFTLFAVALGAAGCASHDTLGTIAVPGAPGGRTADAAVFVQGLTCPT